MILSLQVSGIALVFSTPRGHTAGALLGLTRFVGRRGDLAALYGHGLSAGSYRVAHYLILSRNGPLGQIEGDMIPRLFTPAAMIAAQAIISFPGSGLYDGRRHGVDPQLRLQTLALGATPCRRHGPS